MTVVLSLSESQITIAPLDHKDDPVTFDRMPETKVRIHRNASKLKEGVFVVIVAVRDPASGELRPGAIEVIVLPGRPGGRAGVDPEEVEKLLSLNRAQIKGVLEQVDLEGNWTVGGTNVAVRAVTRLEKGLAIGQFVEVEAALTPEGVLVALQIEAKQVDRAVATRTLIVGSFEGAEGQGVWSISGIPVLVGPDSDTDGLPDQGQIVRVDAFRRADGVLVAREVENQDRVVEQDPRRRTVFLAGHFLGVADNGAWRVGGVALAVNPLTALEGVPKVGSRVKVNALRLENGLLFARKIEGEVEDQGVTQRRVEIRGVIERIEQDRTIVINAVPVKIVALTEIEGKLKEGVFAQVEAFLLDDKTLVARAVRVEETDEVTERSAVRFEGTVQKVNDDDTFVVNGIKVSTTPLSDVKGDVVEGASVQIEGVLSDDGSVMAEVLRGENRRATESRTEVKIEGAIEAIRYDEQRNARFLVVNGLPISLQALTDIAVSLKPGIQVIVRGILHDGVLLARDIRPQEPRRVAEDLRVRLVGEVQAIQTNYENEITGLGIKGVRVQIQRLTKIEATLRVGSLIEVVGTVREGGILALTIKGLDEESPDSDGTFDQTDDLKEVGLRGRVEALRRDVGASSRRSPGKRRRGHSQ